jgi:hypothetical protein
MRKFKGELGGGNSRATPPRLHAFATDFCPNLSRAKLHRHMSTCK